MFSSGFRSFWIDHSYVIHKFKKLNLQQCSSMFKEAVNTYFTSIESKKMLPFLTQKSAFHGISWINSSCLNKVNFDPAYFITKLVKTLKKNPLFWSLKTADFEFVVACLYAKNAVQNSGKIVTSLPSLKTKRTVVMEIGLCQIFRGFFRKSKYKKKPGKSRKSEFKLKKT